MVQEVQVFRVVLEALLVLVILLVLELRHGSRTLGSQSSNSFNEQLTSLCYKKEIENDAKLKLGRFLKMVIVT